MKAYVIGLLPELPRAQIQCLIAEADICIMARQWDGPPPIGTELRVYTEILRGNNGKDGPAVGEVFRVTAHEQNGRICILEAVRSN